MKRKFIWWLGLVTLFVFSVTAYGQWPTYHGDYARTGASPASIDPNTLTLDWFFQPGVGNPLNPGGSNTTGIPIARGGQSAVIGFGKVFYVYNDNSDQDVLVAVDAATGAYLWSFIIRLPGLGAEATQVPTVAVRDTGGPAPDTVVYVYGSNNSVHARNANTGTLIWTRTGINAAAAALNSGAPIVFDTTLIIHDNGAAGASRRLVSALSTRNGTTVWTSAQMPYRMFLGPSLSNDTLFVGGRGSGISGDGGGAWTSIDAKTGATIATYDHALPFNWQHAPVVFGDNLVAVSRDDVVGVFAGSIHVFRHTHDLSLGPSQILAHTSLGFVRFSTPQVYVEPSVGETVLTYGTIGRSGDFPPADIVKRRMNPGVSLRNYTNTAGQVHGPGAVATGNGLYLQGDDAGYWYALDGNTYGFAFAASFAPFWAKQFPSHLTAGAAISLEDDTLVAIIDGNGNLSGWHNGHVTTRSRAQLYYDPNVGDAWGQLRTEVVMGIIPTDGATGNGGFSETTLYCFQNSGNVDLTYDLDWGSSPVGLSASDLSGTITWNRISPTRGKLANRFVEENTITSGSGFMEKKYNLSNRSVKDPIDMEEDGITSLKEIRDFYQKSSYFGTTKLQEAKSKMTQTGWLFVNDLTGGSVGAGAPCSLRLVAVNPNVGFGLFFGEVKMFNTNEPDVQGNPLDTTRIPVILAIGYLGQRCHITPDADGSGDSTNLVASNYAHVIAQDPSHGFLWHADNMVGFDGGYELGNSDTTFAGLIPTLGAPPAVPSAVTGWKADSDCESNPGPYTEGSVTVEMDNHHALLAHLAGAYGFTNLPLVVEDYGWAFRDAITPYAKDAIFQTLVISCTGSVAVDSVKLGAWADLDVHNFGANNSGQLADNDVAWQYDIAIPNELYGIARVPGLNTPGVSQTATLWTSAHATSGGIEWLPHDPVEINAQFNAGFKGQWGTHPQDLSIYNGSKVVSLAPGEHYTVTYIWWGADTTGGTGNITTDLLTNRLKEWLRLLGYYRGDAKGNGNTHIDDLQYLSNYWNDGAQDGPEPLPFLTQGDCDGDGDVDDGDVKRLQDFIYAPNDSVQAIYAPIDYDRFVPDPYKNSRPTLNEDANWTP